MEQFGIVVTVLVFGLVFVILLTLAYGGISAAPWVPLWRRDINRLLTIAQVKENETVIDLGAGDGRIVRLAAGAFKARAIGYEIALLPFLIGYITILMHPARRRISWRYRNFFNVDLSEADVVCIFLTPAAMQKLKTKLETELRPGTRVVSFAFSMPGWQPQVVDKPNKKTTAVYCYQR